MRSCRAEFRPSRTLSNIWPREVRHATNPIRCGNSDFMQFAEVIEDFRIRSWPHAARLELPYRLS
jgi:hypothetical protein